MAKNKTKSRGILWRIIILIVFAAILLLSFLWSAQIDYALGLTKVESSAYGGKNSTKDIIEMSAGSGKSLTVHFVDVGQGDACVIELPDNKKMLIDGGKDKEKDKLLKYIDETIDPQDTMLNKKKSGGFGFDYAILTHADEDHCGGFDDVVKQYGAGIFYRPNELASYNNYSDPAINKLVAPYSKQSTLAYMKAIDDSYNNSGSQIINGNDCTIKSQDGVPDAEKYSIEFYSPTKSEYKDRNDYSPIIILTFQNQRFALSGDAEKEAEQIFVENAKNGQGKYSIFDDAFTVNVIKPGHHGSRTSSSQGYLDAITTPSSTKDVLVVISCGFGNSYGHPHIETTNRLKNMGFTDSNILRTDTNSTIVLSVSDYVLYHGADVVRMETPTVAIAGPVNLQWCELCVTVWLLLALILIIQPFISKNRSKIKKATGVDIKNYIPDTNDSFKKIDNTIDTASVKKSRSGASGRKKSSSDIFKSIAAASKKTTSKTGTAKKTTAKNNAPKTNSTKNDSSKSTKK